MSIPNQTSKFEEADRNFGFALLSQTLEKNRSSIIDSIQLPPVSETYEPKSRDNTPVLNALVIFDDHQCDANGTMIRRIRDALASEIPVFCSRDTLRGSVNDPLEEAGIARMQIRYLLEKQSEKWNVLVDSHTKGQLLIIPRSYYGSLTLDEKLNNLGINKENVKKIEAKEIFGGEFHQKVGIDDFLVMFHYNSPTKIRLFLAGHGGVDTAIAGLDPTDYQKFLLFFNKLNCEAIFIQSCFVGGTNKKYQNEVKFPVVLFSIGNFPTKYKKRDYKYFFVNIDKTLQQNVKLTTDIFKRTFQTKNAWNVIWENLAQIQPPKNKGFTPLNEDDSACVITSENNNGNTNSLQTGNIRLLEIFPKYIFRPILLGDSTPVLLSMVNNAEPVHIFSKVESTLSIDDFFEKTRLLFNNTENFSQVLFFQNLTCKEEIYTHVLLVCEKDKSELHAFDSQKEKYLNFVAFTLFGAICSEEVSKEDFFQHLRKNLPEQEFKAVKVKGPCPM